MRRIIVLLIAFWILPNTNIIGQQNNITQSVIRLNPIQMQQMDLFQLEMLEITELFIIESIRLEKVRSMEGGNIMINKMEVPNFQVEIENLLTSEFNDMPIQNNALKMRLFNKMDLSQVVNSGSLFINVNPTSELPLIRSVVRVPNNFQWVKLENSNWNTSSITPIPNPNFKIKGWQGKIEPGIGNYY